MRERELARQQAAMTGLGGGIGGGASGGGSGGGGGGGPSNFYQCMYSLIKHLFISRFG